MLEGDSIRRPLSTRPLRTDFPMLVVESGNFQTWPSLRVKTRLWFEKSYATVNPATVKFVLCLKLIERSHAIKIEKWTSDPVRHQTRTSHGPTILIKPMYARSRFHESRFLPNYRRSSCPPI
ncbi:hypothetical protein V8E54_006632 [Elaphomyces granulatus]